MKESRSRILTYEGVPLWRDDRVLRALGQVASAALVIGFLVFLANNAMNAAEERGLELGFDFLDQSAGFAIGETFLIDYGPADSFGRALAVGILNTLRVALVGIVLTTVLGILIGVARLSSNWLVRQMAGAYVETIRNIPLLVQLFFWFFAVFLPLPPVEESINIGDVLIMNQRGVSMVGFLPTATFTIWLPVVGIALVLAIIIWKVFTSYQLRTGRTIYPVTSALAVLILLPLISWLILPEQPLMLDVPRLGRFNYEGGIVLSSSFSALLVGLVIYTAAFIAEIVRAGIQAVSRGQVEAARSIGLSQLEALRLVIFPQALRVIIPPLISQYLNLTKNSSLAVAIGYPDLFFVGTTLINQAGRALPVFALVMAAYLVMSLTYSLILNIYNRRVRFVEG